MTVDADETCDSILGGRLSVIQPRAGYRFSVDAVLLARFVHPRAGSRVLELGAGSGVISMIVAMLHRVREVTALEIDPALVAMIARSAARNRLDAVRALGGDLRARRIEGLAPDGYDLVLANPPYRARDAGRESPCDGRRAARSEHTASLAEFLVASRRYVREGGRVALVMAAERSAELLAAMCAHRLEPKRVRFVHPYADAPATIVLVEGRKGAGIEAAVAPPLVLYKNPRVYSDEARAQLGT